MNCSKFDCSIIICSTLLAANQLLDTKFINCLNPVNPGSTGFEQLTKQVTNGRYCLLLLELLLEWCRANEKSCRADFSSKRISSRWSWPKTTCLISCKLKLLEMTTFISLLPYSCPLSFRCVHVRELIIINWF